MCINVLLCIGNAKGISSDNCPIMAWLLEMIIITIIYIFYIIIINITAVSAACAPPCSCAPMLNAPLVHYSFVPARPFTTRRKDVGNDSRCGLITTGTGVVGGWRGWRAAVFLSPVPPRRQAVDRYRILMTRRRVQKAQHNYSRLFNNILYVYQILFVS